ncbi:uncharacterized protein LOC117590986 isoform X1 [Drosophila guanche]|uniref:MADF domain-containing protein n=1 Tax=Drosophila guanche TaxID=7266 RepID=A0A3B0K5G3_DROGU|nr:uncharacterized protein LOC117590986 isoform X1 [Drosophila guanche]SPP89454.1 Hypothetical predicted protein [Drosophila guanche]
MRHQSLSSNETETVEVMLSPGASSSSGMMNHSWTATTSILSDEKEVMEEFISCYRHFTALWDSSSSDYLSKKKKEPGYMELLKILRSINGECTVHDVKRKINSLRCCYRREIKKVHSSKNNYRPRLWWFNLMDFLKPVLNLRSPPHMDDSLDETSINEEIHRNDVNDDVSSALDWGGAKGGGTHTSLMGTAQLRRTAVVRQQEDSDDCNDDIMQHNSSPKATNLQWQKFFRLYRSMPQLWMTKSRGYQDRLLKAQSYHILLECLRVIDPTANIHTLKRKINNFRTSYRRELRKKYSSENEYVPTLWYYKELDFLCEVETGELQLEMELDVDLPQLKSLDPQPELDPAAAAPPPPAPEPDDIIALSMHEMNADLIEELDNENDHPDDMEKDDDMFAESFNTETDALGDPDPDPDPEPDEEPEMEAADQTPIMRISSTFKAEEHHSSHSHSHSHDYQTLSPQSMTSNANGLYSGQPKHRKGFDSAAVRHSQPDRRMSARARRPARRRSTTSQDEEYFHFVDGEPSPKQRRMDNSYDHAESECVLIGKRMAAHFRNMRPDQRLFAERIISEVLVYGRMNQLSLRARFVPNDGDGALP